MLRALAASLLLLSVAASCLAVRPPLPPAERGRRLAERTGCYACHGAEGLRGAANPGRTDGTVPGFEDDVMMFAKTRDEIREWIRDGVTAAKRRSQTWRAQRERGVLRMPAYADRLSEPQIEDLVAMVEASAGHPQPDDSLALAGRRRAKELGCTGCHGPGGRFQRPNPGSVRGYVPAWDGPDFPELVRDRAEFSEWVERGRSVRFEKNPLARHFLDRAAVKMPAFRRHLQPGDLDALWAYVTWLRGGNGGAGD